mgnify:CR=1 FL=1
MAVIGYLRVSTGEQSIGAQRHSIEQTHKVETWFADEGVSGAVEALQRPEFAELFKFIRKGDTLIVPAVDRLGRNTIDVLDTVEALQGKGVSIISLREGFDLSTPIGKAMLTMLAAVAELEDSAYAKVDRISTIELLVRYGCYSRAFALTDRYGYEKIPVSCLFRLAHAMILEKEFTEDEELLYLASYVVKQGIYDEIVLCYLRDYFTGSIEDMCSLWDKIRGFQMESDKLEERILTWSVFVRSHPKWEQEMLESYIRQSGKEHVILAYLTYLAIGYFMDGKPLSDQMFDYLDRAWKQGWELDEICHLAMLKHLSTKPQLSEEEEKEAHTLLLAFTKQGLRFAFYKDLPEHLTEGFQIGDRMFIEERQRAEAKVTIHYRTNAEETWKSEPMRNMYQGIFVKEFLLFYGEKMEYYLTFTNRQGEGKTEVKTVSMTGEPKAGKTRYQLLNQMKAARAAGDSEKAEEAFQKYLQQEALVRNCFALVDEKKQQEDTTWNRKI